MSQVSVTFFLLCIFLLIRDFSDCCSYNEVVTGCRLEISTENPGRMECLCGVGCEKEFPYKTMVQCEAALKSGRALEDPCQSNPCLNRGECIQLRYGRFRCECTGTNHHGELCERECPERMASNAFGLGDSSSFPLECINI